MPYNNFKGQHFLKLKVQNFLSNIKYWCVLMQLNYESLKTIHYNLVETRNFIIKNSIIPKKYEMIWDKFKEK